MRTLFLALVGTATLFAAPPPYPSEEAKGYAAEGITKELDFTLVPGTLGTCIEDIQPTRSEWACPLTGAEVRVELGGVKKVVPLDSVSIVERIATPKRPGVVSYEFGGNYVNVFPNGKSIQLPFALTQTRVSAEPNRLLGDLFIGGLDIPTISWLP